MSQALVPVTTGLIGKQSQLTVDARDLHHALGVGRDFSNWIKGRIAKYSFKENEDFVIFANSGENSGRGRNPVEYRLSVNMGKELAMVENNERGRMVRRYFIECERRLMNPDTPTTVTSRKPLDKLVKVWAVRAAIPYQQAWTMLDSHFCLTDIKDLPLSKLQEAIAWVQDRIDALPPEQPKALPAPERTFANRKEAFFAHVEEFRLRTVRDVEELSNEGSNLIDRERFGFGVYVNLSVLLAQWIRKQVDSPIPVGAFSDTTIKLIEALDEMKS